MDITPILNKVAPINKEVDASKTGELSLGENQALKGETQVSNQFAKLLNNLKQKLQIDSPLQAGESSEGASLFQENLLGIQAPPSKEASQITSGQIKLLDLNEELSSEVEGLELTPQPKGTEVQREQKNVTPIMANAPQVKQGESQTLKAVEGNSLSPELKKIVGQKIQATAGMTQAQDIPQQNKAISSGPLQEIVQEKKPGRGSIFMSKDQLKMRGEQNTQKFRGNELKSTEEFIIPGRMNTSETKVKAPEKSFVSPYTMKALVRQELNSPKNQVNKAQVLNQYMKLNRGKARMINVMPESATLQSLMENQTSEVPVQKMNQFELAGHQPVQIHSGMAQNSATQINPMMSALGGAESMNPELTADNVADEVITKINQYIESTRMTGKDQLKLKVHQENLGQFQINIKNQSNGQVEILIKSADEKVTDFFKENQGKLMSSLMNNGVKVSEFKLDHQSMKQDENGSSQKGYQSSQSQSHGDGHSGSERRQEMWEYVQERLSA